MFNEKNLDRKIITVRILKSPIRTVINSQFIVDKFAMSQNGNQPDLEKTFAIKDMNVIIVSINSCSLCGNYEEYIVNVNSTTAFQTING